MYRLWSTHGTHRLENMSVPRRVLFLLLFLLLPLQSAIAVAAAVSPIGVQEGPASCHSSSHAKGYKDSKNFAVSSDCAVAGHCVQHCLSPALLSAHSLTLAAFIPAWQPASETHIKKLTLAPPDKPPLV